MSGVNTNRGSTGINLPAEVAAEIWSNMQDASAVQTLAREIQLPGRGAVIPIITADPTATFVAETGVKAVANPTFANKLIQGQTLAVVVPFSNQFLRDASTLYSECVNRLPLALAKAFDTYVFGSGGSLSNFAQLGGASAVALTPGADVSLNTYTGLVQAYTKISTAGGELSGWALSPAGKGLLLGQVDTTGRPLLLESMTDGTSVPTLLGERVAYSRAAGASGTPNVVGFAGDWSNAVWGSVEGVQISVSEGAIQTGTATVDSTEVPVMMPLWQQNMFAVRAEIEIGFQVADTTKFVKLTDATRVSS